MRVKTLLFQFVVSLSLLWAAPGTEAQNKEPLTLESIFATGEFSGSTVENIQWSEDGSAFTYTKRNPSTGLLDRACRSITEA